VFIIAKISYDKLWSSNGFKKLKNVNMRIKNIVTADKGLQT